MPLIIDNIVRCRRYAAVPYTTILCETVTVMNYMDKINVQISVILVYTYCVCCIAVHASTHARSA